MRRRLNKLLFPGWRWVLLADLLGGVSLVLTFCVFGEYSPFAYASYLFSAYALSILAIAALTPALRALRRFVDSIPLAHRFLTDNYFKVRSSLTLSVFINLCYAGLKLFYAVRYASFWEGTLTIYNILLCVVRVYLIRRMPSDSQTQDCVRELRYYRTTGIFLVGLDLALSGIATQIVRDGQSYYYSGTLIFAVATYAFYSLTIAIVNTVKFRKFKSPVLSAAKVVSLTNALVSIFNLETAMIAQFGADQTHFRLVMTACTAFAVCVIVLGTAVFMVISSNRKLRRLSI